MSQQLKADRSSSSGFNICSEEHKKPHSETVYNNNNNNNKAFDSKQVRVGFSFHKKMI